MGRPNRKLNGEDGPLARFAEDLRQLRFQADGLTYRQLAQRAHYSTTTLSDAAGGTRFPSLEVTLAYVRGCGGDVEAWRDRWRSVADELNRGPQPGAEAQPQPQPAGPVGATAGMAEGMAEGMTPDGPSAGSDAPTVIRPRAGNRPKRDRGRRLRAAHRWRYPVGAGLLAVIGGLTLVLAAAHHQSGAPAGPPRAGSSSGLSGSSSGASGSSSGLRSGPTGPPNRAGATFTSTAGPECGQTRGRTMNVYNSPKADGWHSATAAGWTGSDCTSSFLYTSATNIPTDPNQWQDEVDWKISSGLSGRLRCEIAVYVPNSPRAAGIAHYFLGLGSISYQNRITSFSIDQGHHRGTWITVGTYPFDGGKISMVLGDLGLGSTATIAAGPMHVSC